MDFPQLFVALTDRSLRVSLCDDGSLSVVGDSSRLTEEMKDSLRQHRDEFLRLLHAKSASSVRRGVNGSVRIGRQTYRFDQWREGDRLISPIAIDTETEAVDLQAHPRPVPKVALATVSDGKHHQIVHPDDLGAFITSHADCHFICHNAIFDYQVIEQALDFSPEWREVCNSGRLHCTMLLEALIRLARKDEEPVYRDLGRVSKYYLGVVIDKDDPFRIRYGEIIGKPWDQCEAGFFTYAIKDAIVTHQLYETLSATAKKLIEPFADELLPKHREAFGLLTETLQVRASIALDHITRNGMRLDRSQVDATRRELSGELNRLVAEIESLPEATGVFRRVRKTGELTRTATGKPSTDNAKLLTILESLGQQHEIDVPRTKTGRIGSSMKFWSQYAELSPFLLHWVNLEATNKLCQFFAGLVGDRIHPTYSVLVRTGRTSCRSPNIQQLPRSGGFREMVIPSPGHYFLAVDYSAVELRTLAAVCVRRYGESQLANVISDGVDPHAFTAAMFEGVSLETFADHPDRKSLRQRSKALNFGIPGGLGARSLVTYARQTYGVTMTIDQASAFRKKLVEEVYPELSRYLADDAAENLAFNLKTTTDQIAEAFDSPGLLGAAKRIVAGKGKSGGGEYAEGFAGRIWRQLARLNQNPRLTTRLDRREPSDQLSRDLFFGPVASLTGRIRGSVGFSQARNTPFQSIASDGAKLALWNLYCAGFRCVAFIHDEVIVELPVDSDHTADAKTIDGILCDSMQQLTGSIPIACEYALTDRWYKQAEAVFEAGKLQLWEPPRKQIL